MKTIIKYITIISALFSLNSCESELMNYEGDAGVYFAVQFPWQSGYGDSTIWELSPVSNVSFFLQKRTDSTIKVRVQITGNTLDRDRQFKVVVADTGNTAKVNYDYDPIPEIHTIRANTQYTDIPIKVYKQADLANTSRKIILRLEETADFRLPIGTWYPWPDQHKWSPSVGSEEVNISAIEHTIIISDIIKEPEGWYSGLLGKFTIKKFNLMCEMFDLTINDFSKEAMNTSRATAYGQRFDTWLQTQKQNGNEILEEDGTPMKMGNYLYGGGY